MTKKTSVEESDKTCFVIMPISDPDGYEGGHFRRVYEDLFKPACEFAGYNAIRADDVTQTSLIHLDILKQLIQAPMALCDLSSRNPNVLFELGLRQAFDRPTVLVQESGTPRIFDIAPLRILDYLPALKYREVVKDQKAISAALKSTKSSTAEGDVNSLVRLLELVGPATLKSSAKIESNDLYYMIRAEFNQFRAEFLQTPERQKDPKIHAVDRKIYGHLSRFNRDIKERIAAGDFAKASQLSFMARATIELQKENWLDLDDSRKLTAHSIRLDELESIVKSAENKSTGFDFQANA